MNTEIEEYEVDHTCPKNEGVICTTMNPHCERCGWDPKVAQARLEKFCKKHGIAYPLPQIQKEG